MSVAWYCKRSLTYLEDDGLEEEKKKVIAMRDDATEASGKKRVSSSVDDVTRKGGRLGYIPGMWNITSTH